MRSAILILALSFLAVLPGSALAVAPINDTMEAPTLLAAPWSTANPVPTPIPAQAPAGGWLDATTSTDTAPGAPAVPSCFLSAGYYSMWYAVDVPEASVLTVKLATPDGGLYQPLVTILDPGNNPGSPNLTGTQLACALGGANSQSVLASSYVPSKGRYLVRVASAVPTPADDDAAPTLQLSAWLRDVTPPHLDVAVSKIVGVRKPVTFDATASTDGDGSGIDLASAMWTFYDGGPLPPVPGSTFANPLVASYAWRTAGFHLVTLSLADMSGNRSVYSFNVLVHSFVAPKMRVRVIAPKPGATSIRVVVTHDMPVRVRVVVLQTGSILRVIPSQVLKGSNVSTPVSIPLKQRVKKAGNVFVSGTASDLSTNPNTVALRTCSVRPGKPGMTCA